jgi:hypothetical protein
LFFQRRLKSQKTYLSLLNVVLVGGTDLFHFNEEIPEYFLEIFPLERFVKEVDNESLELDLIHVLEFLLHEPIYPLSNKGFVVAISWLLPLRVLNGHRHIFNHLEQHV